MCNVSLTDGALSKIMSGEKIEDAIVQVLGSKRIASGSPDKDRYRLLLSDGKHLISFAMLTTQISDKQSGEIPVNTIIKIKRYITSVINNAGKSNKYVLVILELETLVPGANVEKIGNPEALPENNVEPKPSNSVTNGQSSFYKPPPRAVQVNSVNSNRVDMNASLQDSLTHPISSLSPYHNKWVIKARVSSKSNIRTWSNSRGEGKLFSVDLVDESGDIRATAFKDAVDKFYDLLQVDKIYYISKCQLKVANKQFNTTKNDYEMTFNPDTVIEECHDNDSSIPQAKYNFVTIDKIASVEVGQSIDVIGVCKAASDVTTFQARSTGRELKKRTIDLVDQTQSSVELTLWNTDAEQFDGSSLPVLAVKGAKVGEFGGGKNISLMMSSIIKVNPDIPEAHVLRGWFDNGGANITSTNISSRSGTAGLSTPWMSFKDMTNEHLGQTERGDYFQNKATILLFKSERCYYKACPNENCNKKVVDLDNGMYNCEACKREYPNFKYRLLGLVNLGDWSGNQWVSMFAPEAEKVLGMTSQEFGEAIEQDSNCLLEITDKANFKQFIFKYRAKMETFNDENRLKVIAIRAEPINYKEYNAHLVTKIRELINN